MATVPNAKNNESDDQDGLTPVLLSINVEYMEKRIESRDNPTYKKIAALRQPRRSRESSLVFLEGVRLCADALASGVKAVFVLVSDAGASVPLIGDLIQGLPGDTELISLPDRLFAALCETEQPQGLALVCQSPMLATPAGPPEPDGLYLVAEAIQDPGNLGTMIRTADAFNFDGVILTDGTVYPFNDKVMRAAMGSCFHVPLIALPDAAAVADWLGVGQGRGTLLAADAGGETGLSGDLVLPAALLIGNEGQGISELAGRLCTRRVGIRMPGRAESLNAAAAAAILCHELMNLRFTLRGKVL